jgi:hypothetical protein
MVAFCPFRHIAQCDLFSTPPFFWQYIRSMTPRHVGAGWDRIRRPQRADIYDGILFIKFSVHLICGSAVNLAFCICEWVEQERLNPCIWHAVNIFGILSLKIVNGVK